MFKVRVRGTAMVTNFEAQDGGIFGRRIGWSCAPDGTWSPSNEVLEVPERAEYRRALADGSLWPADAATANAVGVAFDPTFGGEKPAKSSKGSE